MVRSHRALRALLVVGFVGAGLACSSASSGPDRVASTSEGLLLRCSQACPAWEECGLTLVGSHEALGCVACGRTGQVPCGSSAVDAGCQSIGGVPMGSLDGLCAVCGDSGERACDAAWVAPGRTQPWFGGCAPVSAADPGQPLLSSGGTCVPCGLPGQPTCSCPASDPACQIAANVTVDLAETGTIGPRFLGLSYEKGHLDQGLFVGPATVAGVTSPGNTALMNLLGQLGPGILRIGGGPTSGVDDVRWNAAGLGKVPGEVGPPDVQALASFLNQTGWAALYGVPMVPGCPPDACPVAPNPNGCTDPTATQTEAGSVATALGASLYGFEFGNEPEYYAICNVPGLSDGTSKADAASYQDFLGTWTSLAADVRASAPDAMFTGPAASGGLSGVTTYAVPFASDAGNQIGLLTQHYYEQNVPSGSVSCGGQTASVWTTGPGTAGAPTCDGLLAALLHPDPVLGTELADMGQAVAGTRLPFRLSEANSFSGGGVAGVSDTQASALWVIDFLFQNALAGSSGVNLHGGGFGDTYTPIADHNDGVVCDSAQAQALGTSCHLSSDLPGHVDPGVRAEYYGLLLFARAGQGRVAALPVSFPTGSTAPLTGYAVIGADASVSYVLVNHDPTKTVTASIDYGRPASRRYSTFVLTGPSLTATSGLTFGGTAISPDAPWAGTPQAGGFGDLHVTVAVPPASATLTTVRSLIARL
ncbi:MAG TPA: glycosyl hydrolase family 79 C-terminal domain-containing protein [Polyangiaceae bacterium]|jgi:hypothetical protein